MSVFFKSNGIISNYPGVVPTISSELDAEKQVINIRTITHIEQVISNDPNYRPPQEDNSDEDIATEVPVPMPVLRRIPPKIPARFKLNHLRPLTAKTPQNGGFPSSEAASSFDFQEQDSSGIRQNSGKGFSMVGRALNSISQASQPSRMFQPTARSMPRPGRNVQPENSDLSPFMIDLPPVDPRVKQALKLPKNSKDRNKLFDGDKEMQKKLKYHPSAAQLVLNEEYIEKTEQELHDLHKKYPLYDHSLLRIIDAEEPRSDLKEDSQESSKQPQMINLPEVQKQPVLEKKQLTLFIVKEEQEQEQQNSKDKQPTKLENESENVQNRLEMYDASVHHLLLNGDENEDDSRTPSPPQITPAVMLGVPS